MELGETIVCDDEDCGQIVLILQHEALSFEENIMVSGLESEYAANEEKFCFDANVFCDKLKGRFSLSVYYLHDASLFIAYLKRLYGDSLNASSWNKMLESISNG